LRPANKCLTPGLRPQGWRKPRLSCRPASEFEPGATRATHGKAAYGLFLQPCPRRSVPGWHPLWGPPLIDGRPLHKAVVQLRHYEMWAGFLARSTELRSLAVPCRTAGDLLIQSGRLTALAAKQGPARSGGECAPRAPRTKSCGRRAPEVEQYLFAFTMNGWPDLLARRRVVFLSEAGSAKTTEMTGRAKQMLGKRSCDTHPLSCFRSSLPKYSRGIFATLCIFLDRVTVQA
jgi:hypothetical protein